MAEDGLVEPRCAMATLAVACSSRRLRSSEYSVLLIARLKADTDEDEQGR